MAKIILKWRYLKPGAKAHNENLVKYIAKREGVDKIDDSWKAEPVSKAQQNMIDELLQEFPESKDSYEYQDLLRQPNKGNASEFITRTIEENLDQVDKRENYVQYIAKRPRVEKIGTHGLFTDDNVPVHLNEVAEEVATHQGVLMTQILSLRREDAARLGYEKGEAWRTLIRNHTKDMAEAMNIPMEDLRWYAAFHNESHHPHCHIIAYSIGKEPYITQERLLKLKSAFGSEMFRNERMQAFQEQTKYRDQLAEETRQLVSRIVDEINTGVYQNETVALMLQSLSEYVQRAKGKKQYGYLHQSARNLVNGIIDELAKDPRIESLYELWYKQSVEIASIYQDNPPVKPPLSENKSFHKVRNIVVQEAMNLLLEPQELEPFVEKADEVVEQEMPVPQIVEPETVMIPTEVIEVPEEDPNSEEPEFKPPTILKPFFYRGNDGNWWSQNYKDARRFLYGTKESPPDFENARKLLAEEAEHGNGLAMYDLGKMYLDGLDCDADEIVAQEWFGKALNAFHKRERTDQQKDYWQYRIGKMHSLGHGTDQDYEVSAQWFAKATQEDNPYSQYALGGQYQRGQGVEQSYEQAVALYTQAAENTSRPNAYAQYQLGNLYKEGLGVAVDPKQSAKWYAMAYQSFLKMEQSMADDKLYYRLGSMNLNGIGTVQNLAIAKDYLEKAAALGNVDAKYGLGKLHLLEDPEIYDPTKAMAYLEEAAENDHSYAQYKLGKLLIEGTIVSADLSKGIRWLESSAEQDNPYAQYYLGKLYLYGDVVEADPDRALVLLSRAIRQGNLPAEYLLGKALWEGKHISANQNRALELLTDAAERNYDPAMYALAKIYLAGYVSDADIAKALELLEKAAEADNQFAQYQLGKMLLFGQHVEQDEEAGKEWLRRSAAQGNIYAQRLLDNYGRAPLGLMAFRLLGHLARIIQDDIEQKQETNRQLIDRKLLSKIAEKKQAQGQKMG